MRLSDEFLGKDRLVISGMSRWRPDQFGDLVAVLKLGTVDSSDGTGVAQEGLCDGFYGPHFAGTWKAHEQEITDWSIDRTQPGEINLICPANLAKCFVVPGDNPPKCTLRALCLGADLGGVQYCES
jgi:hypothetical protein